MLLCAARCGLLKTYTHRRLQSFEFVDGCVSSDLGEVATVEVDEHAETPRFRSRYATCVYKRSNVGVDSNALGISVWTTEMSFVVGSDVRANLAAFDRGSDDLAPRSQGLRTCV